MPASPTTITNAALLKHAAWGALETAIDAALRYDPGTCIALGRLQGQVLAVESTAPAFTVYFAPHSRGVAVMGTYAGAPTTQLRGPLPALLSLSAGDGVNLAGSGVEAFGSTALLSDLQRILAGVDIDWEEAVSRWLGDVVGREGAQAIRASLGWCRARASAASRLLGEYLTEELRSLPARPELERFYDDVDELRLAVDRFEARLSEVGRQRTEDRRETSDVCPLPSDLSPLKG